MHRVSLFFLLLLSVILPEGSPCIAQLQWTWQNPLPNGNTLYDVAQFKNGDILIVGSAGTIMRSTDHGSSWDQQFNLMGTSAAFRRVFFISDAEGWIVGDSGLILHSTDAGHTWSALPPISNCSLTCLSFISPSVGCVGGNLTDGFGSIQAGRIWRTTDGGSSWDTADSSSGSIFDMVFATDSIAFAAAANGYVLRSSDAGSSWKSYSVGLDCSLNAVTSASPDTVWAGGCFAFRSTDSGLTWSICSGLFGSIASLQFLTATEGWVALDRGIVCKTTDGGSSWQGDTLESGWSWLLRAHLAPDGGGIAVGSSGMIFMKDNSAVSWTKFTTGVADDIESICSISSQIVWVGGWEGLLMHSVDGGATWDYHHSPDEGVIREISFGSELFGCALGGSRLLKTTNGGRTWQASTPPSPLWTISSLSFIDSTTGWIAGDIGIMKTTNRGISWTQENLRAYVFQVEFLDRLHGFALIDGQSLARTTDGGETWTAFNIDTMYIGVRKIHFASLRIGWAVGLQEAIWKTTDSGTTWSLQHFDGSSLNFFHGIDASSETHACAVGGGGGGGSLVARTTNGGTTWETLRVPTSHFLLNVELLNDTSGWIVGYGGTLLKMGSTGSLVVQPEYTGRAPLAFTLYQNYPNPFNPSTRIEYFIPEKEHVRIDVFNILGERIATLVDAVQTPGRKSVEFNGNSAGLPSGFYLYQIRTPEASSMKKMLLIR